MNALLLGQLSGKGAGNLRVSWAVIKVAARRFSLLSVAFCSLVVEILRVKMVPNETSVDLPKRNVCGGAVNHRPISIERRS